MGIKPSGTTPIIVPQDNVQSRWGAYESSLDTSGQVAGEVFAETHAIANSSNQWISENGHKLQNLLDDSAGYGDESKTIQQQMRELIDPENEDSKLWVMQSEINRLSSERDDAQDEALDLLGDIQELQNQQITRMLPVVGGSVGAEDDRVRIVKDNGFWRITRIGTWAGSGVFHGSFRLPNPTRYDNEPWILDFVQTASGKSPMADTFDGVFYYSVKPGVPQSRYWAITDGSLPNSGAWFTEQTMTTGTGGSYEYDVLFRVTWGNADRGSTYGMRVIRTDTQAVLWEDVVTGIGPLTPFDSGVRTRSATFKRTWPAGIPLAFQTYATGGSSQRWINGGEIRVLWVEGNQ